MRYVLCPQITLRSSGVIEMWHLRCHEAAGYEHLHFGSHVVAVAGFKPARSIARGKARETSDATRGGMEMALPLHDRSTIFAVVAAQHRRCDILITPHVSVS